MINFSFNSGDLVHIPQHASFFKLDEEDQKFLFCGNFKTPMIGVFLERNERDTFYKISLGDVVVYISEESVFPLLTEKKGGNFYGPAIFFEW